MYDIQLKMSPHRVALVADAIERDIGATGDTRDTRELTEILTWLRHRIALVKSAEARKAGQ